ncbi:hypothetical protein M9H77_09228 [Catharanthus roseus]|uniref:Uncharacterized protein n=1 Tax=Catharanthus roseus TaxID=4058 RepID=A0ACC0BZZ3_CATRO|nr:hypothetical protein M9H77_09228 [Catharanthus roseus]
MLQEIDDMTTGVLEGPLSSPRQYASVMRKVQTIIRRCMVFVGGTFDVPQDPFDNPNLNAPTLSLGLKPLAQSHLSGTGTSYVPHPSTGGTSYAPPPPDTVGCSFDVPPPPSTTGLSVLHMLISRASSFDLDEHADEPTDNVTPTQQLGFGYRIGKKTTRFMPSDCDSNYCAWYIQIKKKATHGHWEISRSTKERAFLVQVHQNKHRNMTSKFISKLISASFMANGENIHCFVLMLLQSIEIIVQDEMLMCQIYIRGKLTEEHTNPTFIWLDMRTFGEMLLTI